jgi:hypothetical protein
VGGYGWDVAVGSYLVQHPHENHLLDRRVDRDSLGADPEMVAKNPGMVAEQEEKSCLKSQKRGR